MIPTMKWLTIISSLLLSTVSTSNSSIPPKFFNTTLHSPPELLKKVTDSESDQDSISDSDAYNIISGSKRKMGDAGFGGTDLTRLGLNRNIHEFLLMPTELPFTSDDLLMPLPQASTPVSLLQRSLVVPSSNESYNTSNASQTTMNSVNSYCSSAVMMFESGSEVSTGTSNFMRTVFDRRTNQFSTAPFGHTSGPIGTDNNSLSDGGSLGNGLFEHTIYRDDVSRINPSNETSFPRFLPINSCFNFSFRSGIASAASDASDEESANFRSKMEEDDNNEFGIDLLLKMCGTNSFNTETFQFPIEAQEAKWTTSATELFDVLRVNSIDQISPRAKSYSFSDPFLYPEAPSPVARQASGSPLFGKPLCRIESQLKFESSNESTFSSVSINLEFAPWLPDSPNEIFAPIDSEVFMQTFGLSPFRTDVECVEQLDSEMNRKYFPNDFKPFRTYGEFPEDKEKMEQYLSATKADSYQVSATISKVRAKKLKARYKEGSKSRHNLALEFAKKASMSDLMEGEWIHRILAGGAVDFFDVAFDFNSPTEPWTVSRGRKFINVLIPSIFHSLHVEENLIDFLDDFFLIKIVKKANDQISSESERIALSSELTKIAKEMIKQLISSPIFEKFISFVQPILTPNDAETLYNTLVDTMKVFKLPLPYIAPLNPPPVPPSRLDSKYNRYKKKESKEAAYAEDENAYIQAVADHKAMAVHITSQKRFRSEIMKNKRNQKSRSFEYLKVLVNYIADPIMRPDSRWINGSFLNVQNAAVDSSEMMMGSEIDDFGSVTRETKAETGSEAKVEANQKSYVQNPRTRSKTRTDQKNPKTEAKTTARTEANAEVKTTTTKTEPPSITELLMGRDAHENQDFFDTLFFSRILRACLILEHTVSFAQEYLDPFFNDYKFLVSDSPIGLRYLKAVNKFILLSRFNVVANVHPQIISYRRFLAAYLCRNGANMMGIDPTKVQARSISMELFSLFETIHLFQIFGVSTEEEKSKRLSVMLSTKEVSFQIPIIFLTYNMLNYIKIGEIIEKTFNENKKISSNKLNAYYEILAMSKNVDLLPIHDRKVLKFINPTNPKGPEELVYKLENINQPMLLRPKLPDNYEAVYNWSMSRRLKNLSAIETHLKYPYGTYAVRMLLARRFGISFDASNFNAQFEENFTWLEGIGFANFYLERQAQFLINNAYSHVVDADHYQVYRVSDPQSFLHRSRNLGSDEPTHYINVLINSALSAMPKSELPSIDRAELFARYLRGMDASKCIKWYNLPKEVALDVLRFFLNEDNRPEDFNPLNYPGMS